MSESQPETEKILATIREIMDETGSSSFVVVKRHRLETLQRLITADTPVVTAAVEFVTKLDGDLPDLRMVKDSQGVSMALQELEEAVEGWKRR